MDNGFQNISKHITDVLTPAVGRDYAKNLGDDKDFSEAVVKDIMATSAWQDEKFYNYDDVRLAIGRVLMYRLGIWY